MLFVKALEFIYGNILLNILILIGFIWFCIWAYKKSVKSRKYYRCPQCGESFRSEHMDSKCCKVCGAQLDETEEKDVNDKAV
ncbi:MAG: hypothetical protein ACLSA2_06930 [Candidatus Gastranaerophilaceae bacterium]|nr:unknown [Clostridium sp. CAG:967]